MMSLFFMPLVQSGKQGTPQMFSEMWALTKPEAVWVFSDTTNPCAAEAHIGEPLPL